MSAKKQDSQKINLTQSQWLNIIIITVSAMLLASVLIDRMLNKASDNTAVEQSRAQQNVIINKIDFGEFQFSLVDGVWQSSAEKIAQPQLLLIVAHWQSLLQQSGEPLKHSELNGHTLLIYLSNKETPIIVKLAQLQGEILISFVTAKREFLLPASDYKFYYPS